MKETSKIREKRIETLLRDIKYGNTGTVNVLRFTVDAKNIDLFLLRPKISHPKSISLLTDWRKKNDWWFPSQFKVTYEGTKVADYTAFRKKEEYYFS